MSSNRNWRFLLSWEGLLTFIVILVVLINIRLSPFFLHGDNLINLFGVSIEKIIVALVMTFIIINGEIDLSIASIMGLAASLAAWLTEHGMDFSLALVCSLLAGVVCGAINGFFVAYLEMPSLVVTLAGLIAYRGVARILLEDRSFTGIPPWYNDLGTQPILGQFPLSLLIFFALFVIAFIILHFSAFGRLVYVIGNNKDAALMSGVRVRRVKMTLFIASGIISALAGLLYVSRLGAVQASIAEGFELDIITIVLLGGVSIFGGTGTMVGVGLSILLILSLRNGMSLASVTGNTQSSIIGLILILSVLIPNLAQQANQAWKRRGYLSRPKEAPISKEGTL
ncbi:MAG: ABC transporter permease [Chloroflexota bacterium]